MLLVMMFCSGLSLWVCIAMFLSIFLVDEIYCVCVCVVFSYFKQRCCGYLKAGFHVFTAIFISKCRVASGELFCVYIIV